MFVERTYRKTIAAEDLEKFRVCVGQSDILVYVGEIREGERGDLNLKAFTERLLFKYRGQIKEYISRDPLFLASLKPYPIFQDAPQIVKSMALAGQMAGTGPMAAVAGAIAEFVGRDLLKVVDEVILENGGDIFISTNLQRKIGIFAGDSPFSGRLAMLIKAEATPLGICTSSGTVGSSLSFGTADAVVITSKNSALADAVATGIGNIVKSHTDIPQAIEEAKQIPGVLGVVVIKGSKMGVWGEVELVR